MKNNIIALSIFSLALAIVLGSWLIAGGLSENAIHKKELLVSTTPTNEIVQPQMFTKAELASYLGLSEEEIEMLGPVPTGPNTTTSVLPYLKIGKTVYYPKEAVDRWLRDMQVDIVY